MPKVIGYTPPWLSSGNPGAAIFSANTPTSSSPSRRPSPKKDSISPYDGPTRLIAHRGTEVFVAVGKEIRWADLAKVQNDWESHPKSRTTEINAERQLYRTLSVSVHDQEIRQLVISPSGHFLAICAEHTIRIAILPDSSRLGQDTSPLKLKTFQLGPATHVKPEAALASVLWHPLAHATNTSDCLITITIGAAVRLWEIDRTNQWSFERPSLAIDLRKLADGVSCDDDFTPLAFGKNRGFSVDDVDMEVASACFGGKAVDEEDPWASMTVWTAMSNGDVYALCPLLPSKWCPTNTTVPSLTTAAVARIATIDSDAGPDERQAADQQYEWVQEIDEEEPLDNADIELRYRPQNPSAIPRLQGPFTLNLDDEAADVEITDIAVFPAHLDEYDVFSAEDDFDDPGPSGLPFTTILLATSDSKVHITLHVDNISGQWLPKQGRSTFSVPDYEGQDLAIVEVVSFQDSTSPYLLFSSDPVHPHSVFCSSASSIHSLSLDDWSTRIASEIASDQTSGLQTRLSTSCKSQIAITESILTSSDPLTAPIVLVDESVGYFLLSTTSTAPVAATLDQPRSNFHTSIQADFRKSQDLSFQLARFDETDDTPLPTRQIYAPPRILHMHPAQPLMHLTQNLHIKQKHILKENPMRLSPAMLDIMTSTHRTVSRQTTELENAAAELFRRCERLKAELGEQVKQMVELADRLQRIGGGEDSVGEKKTPETRLREAKERHVAMVKRYEALRRKIGGLGVGGRELSTKEVAFGKEIDALGKNVGVDGADADGRSLSERYNEVSPLFCAYHAREQF
jgi:nucleoporin NUP82